MSHWQPVKLVRTGVKTGVSKQQEGYYISFQGGVVYTDVEPDSG
jgi:hypothetical protein